jgi:tetratricopeptide (TPR) repeat protein
MLADGADGRFEQFSLMEAALMAEGVACQKQARQLASQFAQWETELKIRTARITDTRRRAAVVHDFVHRRILTGKYEIGCNQLSRTIQHGDFNCVTATLVSLALGRSCELPLTAVHVPGHVRARLPGTEPLDIETTCPHWLPQKLPPATRSTTGPSRPQTPDCPKNEGRELSDAALVAKIYYNRGIALLNEQHYAHAVAVTRAALALDPADEPTRKNLLAVYNNWALSLCRQGDYAAAADLAVYALGIGSDFPPLVSNDLHIHQQWVLHLCDAGRFAEALAVLEKGHQRRPDAELFDRGRGTVRRWWAESSETIPVMNPEID